jgi:dUTP pyrophosphatase
MVGVQGCLPPPRAERSLPVLDLPFTRLPHGEGLPAPSLATPGSAGYDVASADEWTLAPLERRLFRTGFAVAIPGGFECQIRPRSGLALKHGITLPNSPATIDSDYRGELMVALVNLGTEAFHVTRGMRVAQLVFARVEHAVWREQAELPPTARGEGGFGSSGTGRLGE